ncbi:MAG: M23 family metallopeptidase [Alphaproteobacteria bacterium]|nr:M23 family metallopeptidase [Alphaproteobacteria bacterium]
MNGKKMDHRFNNIAVIVALLFLTSCTFWRQPEGGMVDKNTLMAGEEITIEQGDNVYSLARKHSVSMRDLIAMNDLKSPYTLPVGGRLTLPLKRGGAPKVPSAAPLGSIETVPLEPISSKPVSSAPLSQATPPSLAPEPLKPQPLTTTVAKSKSAAVAALKSTEKATGNEVLAASSFVATPPVQGPIVSSFGSKSDGLSNDGINIGAPKGASVVAAAGGIVVYSGNDMKGFGNLILIRHEGGWVTAYTHLDRMLVSRDAVVAGGDMIGTVGTSGGVASPQLHFETRLNGKPVDPQTLLKQTE